MSTPTTIIVLFNLKPGVSVADYEAWARSTDLPIVRGLKSIAGFDVLRTTGLLGGGAAPYAYVEIVRIADMGTFQTDVATETMQRVAGEFQTFADRPQFILTEAL